MLNCPPFLKVFVNVHNHFRIRTQIRNPRVVDPDPEQVTDHCGSGSGSATLLETIGKYFVLV
jgi:hypothetical protein